MSQTIIALCTAEQLASTIPDWQQHNTQQIQTKQSRNPSGDMTDSTLLFEIFKFAAWGLDNKDYQEKVNELLYTEFIGAEQAKNLRTSL